jgi:hypothetical protein
MHAYILTIALHCITLHYITSHHITLIHMSTYILYIVLAPVPQQSLTSFCLGKCRPFEKNRKGPPLGGVILASDTFKNVGIYSLQHVAREKT